MDSSFYIQAGCVVALSESDGCMGIPAQRRGSKVIVETFQLATNETSVLWTEQWEGGDCEGQTLDCMNTDLFLLQFETFYVQKHSGRKLSFLHHMSIG